MGSILTSQGPRQRGSTRNLDARVRKKEMTCIIPVRKTVHNVSSGLYQTSLCGLLLCIFHRIIMYTTENNNNNKKDTIAIDLTLYHLK
jgi:hypothetical protein